MRIAYLTSEYAREGYPEGGLANYLARLCSLLGAAGHQPVIFVLSSSAGDAVVDGIRVVEVRRPVLRPRFLRRHFWPYSEFVEQWLESRRLVTAFEIEHGRRAFDIVQAASFRAVGSALIARRSVPLVVRISSYNPLLRAAKGLRRTLAQHMIDWLEIRQILGADGVFAPSRFLAEYIDRGEGLTVPVIRTPYHVPPVEEATALYQARLRGKTYLLYVGKMTRLKGADVLADALPRLFRAYPDLHLAVAGGDSPRIGHEETLGAYMLQQAGRFSGQVHLLGVQPRRCLLPLIRHARVVVTPSRADNYPNSVIEAQVLGKIVVGTRKTSLDEMIEDGVTGFLADPGSDESLLAAIHRALSLSEDERRTMENAVAEWARSQAEKPLADLLEFYREVIVRFQAGRGTQVSEKGRTL